LLPEGLLVLSLPFAVYAITVLVVVEDDVVFVPSV
jgi:hypothetical protein